MKADVIKILKELYIINDQGKGTLSLYEILIKASNEEKKILFLFLWNNYFKTKKINKILN